MAQVKIRKRTVIASSLIEVTVAMLIIVMVFAMALTIYLNVTTSGSTLQKLRYRTYAKDMAEIAKSTRAFVDQSVEVGAVRITKKFSYYDNNPQLLLMEIQILNEFDSVVFRHRELLYTNEQAD